MDLSKREQGRSRWQLGPRWVELCVVSVVTIATGFVTGRVSESRNQADGPEPAATVTVRATETVTASPKPTAGAEGTEGTEGTSDPDNSGTADASSGRPAQVHLSELDSVDYRGYYENDPVQMLGDPYPKSVKIGCATDDDDSVTYNTSGYTALKATLGIPADADNAIGSVARVKVFGASGEQLGDGVDFRSSDTADLSVDISGQDQIKITCALVKSGDPDRSKTTGGLGDAVLTS
ncbi:hypothetical protein ACIGAN_06335 [Streptomyces sp. NPDC085931]|uniref:hypothetical protein n=1 Tax=Streptomyces sp. NPDC085931 TaxID=3365740 RepID=UPI0037D8B662